MTTFPARDLLLTARWPGDGIDQVPMLDDALQGRVSDLTCVVQHGRSVPERVTEYTRVFYTEDFRLWSITKKPGKLPSDARMAASRVNHQEMNGTGDTPAPNGTQPDLAHPAIAGFTNPPPPLAVEAVRRDVQACGWQIVDPVADAQNRYGWHCEATHEERRMTLEECMLEVYALQRANEKYPLPIGMAFKRAWRTGGNPPNLWIVVVGSGPIVSAIKTAEYPGPGPAYDAALTLVKPVDRYPQDQPDDDQVDTPPAGAVVDMAHLFMLLLACERLAHQLREEIRANFGPASPGITQEQHHAIPDLADTWCEHGLIWVEAL